MHPRRILLFTLSATPVLALALALLAPVCVRGQASAEDAFAQNRRLGRGVNIIGYDPLWRSFEEGRFKARHFQLLREAGFNSVRVNLHCFRQMGDGPNYRLPESWLKTLDWAVTHALTNQLAVILDFHEFNALGKDAEANHPRLLAFWRQVAPRFKDAPPGVLFEILNEPNGQLTPELWNRYLAEALAIIRESNPTRTVIIGPAFWNSVDRVAELQLPEADRNLILTVHYYKPMEFTHQGAPWTDQKDKLGIEWRATDDEKAAITRDFEKVQQWATAHSRPVYLGEFGAYDKADMASRARYISFVTREAERLGWSWGYWQFDSDFVLYDIPGDKWIEPIRDALIPTAAAKSGPKP